MTFRSRKYSLVLTSLSILVLSAAPARAVPTSSVSPDLDDKIGALFVPDGLTADGVAERALRTSFEVSASRAALEAAAAEVDRALAAYFPKLTLSARYARLSDLEQPSLGNLVVSPETGPVAPNSPLFAVPLSFPVILNQTSLDASLAAPLSDYLLRIPRAHAAATHDQRSAALTERATARKVAADARALYYAWVRAELQAIVAREALAQSRQHLRDVNSLSAAGNVSRADVLAVEAQVASSELLVVRADHLAARLEEQVRIAMHDEAGPTSGYAIGEDVRRPPPPLSGALDLATLRSEALATRPELAALQETETAIDARRSLSAAGYLPRLDAFAETSYANPNPRVVPQADEYTGTWQAGVRLAWTPSDVLTVRAEREGLAARGREVAARRAQVADGIALEVMQSLQAVSEAQIAVETSGRSLTAAEESYRVRRVLLQNGRATSTELSDAEVALTRARLEAIDAQINVRVARVRLAYAVGKDRPE